MTALMTIKVRDRGNTPRGMKRAFNEASKLAWYDTAVEFHRNYRDKRFTVEHAREAGYAARKGELIPRGTKAFRQSYTGRKLRIHKHTNPLQFRAHGGTRDAVKSATVSSSFRGGKAAYRGASVFNFRHPKSKIRMNEEVRRITAAESRELAEFYDSRLDVRLKEVDAKKVASG